MASKRPADATHNIARLFFMIESMSLGVGSLVRWVRQVFYRWTGVCNPQLNPVTLQVLARFILPYPSATLEIPASEKSISAQGTLGNMIQEQ